MDLEEPWIQFKGYPEGSFQFNKVTWTIILVWLLSPILFYTVFAKLTYIINRRKQLSSNANTIAIVVLGDLGHSPRISYHVRSFLKLGYYVELCGYIESGSSLPDHLYDDDVSINEIKVIKNSMKLPFLIFAVYKVVMQCVNLFQVLSHVIDVDTKYVLIQNPPCLPLLAIVVLIKQLFHPNVKLVIDWHNLNYTVLNMTFQNLNHPAVKFMKWYEMTLSRKFAFLNLTVTEKMRLFLIDEFGLDAKRVVTLYDRPSEVFVPLKSQDELKQIVSENKEVFEGKYDQKVDRILVSATSFTEDEDFSVMVDALAKLDKKLSSGSTTSAKGTIWTVVTGKGPLHDHFLQLVDSHKWNRVIIKSVWLPFDQYCKILRIADLGVSLHYSTSGLDLPMKIVDLFGAECSRDG
ncbi:unnamed protein product [Ambrosiozyma monospora]|uniref:Chitobiosyldiphosphodolichol beta-mannosyltransferase n=1 Tax=Ambrosiozyma monospora TaxID=43982 RepID=A0A9W6Z7E3_AMBMO|nr:unnamed protein product [Ambrosiozyma monospora]